MYSLSTLKHAANKPRLALEEVNRIFNQGFGYRADAVNSKRGVDIMSEDWDTLVILDACRFDTFQELAGDLPGELQKKESKGSATQQFLRANFTGRELHDTVYVTANPQLFRIENGVYDVDPINVSFHDQIDVWQDNWHDDHRTVMPDVVTEAALDAMERYPGKRLIVHYLQPHAPFVGPTGLEKVSTNHLDFWLHFREGEFDVSLDVLKQAYRENLELVLPHVSRLIESREGKTVVTSDHGELFGERDFPVPLRHYGHPGFSTIPALVEVPWLVYEYGVRPTIVAEDPVDSSEDAVEQVDDDVIKARLRDLGYAE